MPKHRFTTIFFGCLATFVVSACTPSKHATPPANDDYILVTLKRGSGTVERTDAERQAIQAAHMANIGRLAEDRKLVVAGPYGKVNHDPSQRGIFILDVTTLDEARALTNTDPAVIAGVLTMELERLQTDADLRGAVADELAAEAAAKQAGRVRPMSEGIRAYVLIRADNGAKAERRLARMLPPGKMVISARVDETKGFYVVDSPDVAQVRGWIGKEIDELGPVTIDEWYGSAMLVRPVG